MRVGVPTEIKNSVLRIGHPPRPESPNWCTVAMVLIRRPARIGHPRPRLHRRRAAIVDTADQVWAEADLLLQGQGTDQAQYAKMRKGRFCSPICTWPLPNPAPTRCWPRAPRRPPTRPCRPPTARCLCWPR